MLTSFVAIPAVAEEPERPGMIFIKNDMVVTFEYNVQAYTPEVTLAAIQGVFSDEELRAIRTFFRGNNGPHFLIQVVMVAGYTWTQNESVFWFRNDGLKPIMVSLDGTLINFPDQQPIIQDGSTLVPVAPLARALGAEVSWDGARQLATITQGNRVIEITIGQSTMTIDGVASQLAIPAQIIGGRTMIPLRATAEALGVGVEWEPGEEVNWIRKTS